MNQILTGSDSRFNSPTGKQADSGKKRWQVVDGDKKRWQMVGGGTN